MKHYTMAFMFENNDLKLISKGLYRGVSDSVGSKCRVDLLRQKYDLQDTFEKLNDSRQWQIITSGSTAEGFSFQSSDYDAMFMDRHAIVLTSYSCHLQGFVDFPTLLLMETECTPHGFALIKCLKVDQKNKAIINSLVFRGDNMYLNSMIIRENFMRRSTSFVHGPCSSGVLPSGSEYDFAYTLHCPFWPIQATSFIHRSIIRGWPPREVILDICREGCLLVPINSKQQRENDVSDLEWRVSFSLAEKKLVYSMNHSQFLCYGLFKLILNEILKKNPEIKELLCSYFMKTAVFWEISENPAGWNPWNFMFKFWNVFRRIIKWVAMGYCPNFFIPEHNMFHMKIYGAAQRILVTRLRELYGEGYLHLLRCESLRGYLSLLIHRPQFSDLLTTHEEDYIPFHMIECGEVFMICTSFVFDSPYNISGILKTLYKMTTLMPTSDTMTSALKLRVNCLMQRLANLLHINAVLPTVGCIRNKQRNKYIKIAQELFRKAKCNLCSSDIKHAECSFLNGNYRKTINIVNGIRTRLEQQRYMYGWCLHSYFIIECRRQDMSYESIINKLVLQAFCYDPYLGMKELFLESYFCFQTTGIRGLYIQPVIFFEYLLILSYIKLKDYDNAKDILDELESLLYQEDGFHIHAEIKAIAWEILGICQQLCGDCNGACQSYINALCDPFNYFKQATLTRINSLYSI